MKLGGVKFGGEFSISDAQLGACVVGLKFACMLVATCALLVCVVETLLLLVLSIAWFTVLVLCNENAEKNTQHATHKHTCYINNHKIHIVPRCMKLRTISTSLTINLVV